MRWHKQGAKELRVTDIKGASKTGTAPALQSQQTGTKFSCSEGSCLHLVEELHLGDDGCGGVLHEAMIQESTLPCTS